MLQVRLDLIERVSRNEESIVSSECVRGVGTGSAIPSKQKDPWGFEVG